MLFPRFHWRALCFLGVLSLSACAGADEFLPQLNLDLRETTVSGVSSGAFMAVQMAVAHSADIKGVAATAGGPYFCAGEASWRGAAVDKAVARCMQGDPAFGVAPITQEDMGVMRDATESWASSGLIDPLSALARQKVWIFHGYNDGIVKAAVSDALQAYYRAFLNDDGQIFYKHELPAAHAQISASCRANGGQCNACPETGGAFINTCVVGKTAYDAAASALQFFYGPLKHVASKKLKGEILSFNQAYYTLLDEEDAIDPIRVSMSNTGYLYVPPACKQGEACRLHIAFHGCRQGAEDIGMAFVKGAGFNEWAENNHLVILYPQAASTSLLLAGAGALPLNPNGCWDWWGYNDSGDKKAGHYATQQGAQIAAVWRMAQALASGADDVGNENGGADAPGTVAAPSEDAAGEASPPAKLKYAPQLKVADVSSDQVMLLWASVPNAARYALYRVDAAKHPSRKTDLSGEEGAQQLYVAEGAETPFVSFVDHGLQEKTAYRYQLVASGAAENDKRASAIVAVTTAAREPACDPYFSMLTGTPVTKDGQPADPADVCP
ncbi:MAG: PHB depolymerase family esterase [Zoogloeaceae bacterium]|jgi:poly(3-hydroxybutyrate) depolymerase|nr:PHB depolymerase family esterase [Zoogloeaceae bacterium]